MSRLHNPDNLMRDKDRDFLGDDGHYWFSFLCPSESRADEDHRHVYQVRDDGEVAFCTCPYATNGGTCTLILCARDVARRARAVDEPPPADPGGAALDAAQRDLDEELHQYPAWLNWDDDKERAYREDQARLDGDDANWHEPPELAGLTECENAARDERRARHERGMLALYGPGWREQGMHDLWRA